MKDKYIYVKVRENDSNKNFFAFNCTGYGWLKSEDLNNKTIDVICEDDYLCSRGFSINKTDLEICKVQKTCIYLD